MRVIIAGSRDFNSYNRLENELNQILGEAIYGIDFEIVSGGARGADRLGEQYARQIGAKIKQFIPNWQGLGRRAGIVRNEVMAKYATHLVAFWDGISPGTRHMIEFAKRSGLTVHVVMV
jgi:YspA, cpYpsA-related SLOG family